MAKCNISCTGFFLNLRKSKKKDGSGAAAIYQADVNKWTIFGQQNKVMIFLSLL